MATQVISISSKETRRRSAALESKLYELLGVSQGREDLRIRDIKLALAQMDEGAYGLCARCEEPIPRNRLDAITCARLCVPCQSQVETGEYDADSPFQDAA